jgi:hypothetical protein
MKKEEIIDMLVLHGLSYEETDKGINVEINKKCFLLLFFSDELLIDCKDKIKYRWRWTSLYSLRRNEFIGFVVLIAFAIAFIFLFINTTIILFVCGVATAIESLYNYYKFRNLINNTKIKLQISL